LVNQLGKLTKEERKQLQLENQKRYGLSEERIQELKLPYVQHLVEVFEIEKILHPRKRTTTIEKLNQLQKLQEALVRKLEMVHSKRITGCRRHSKTLFKGKRESEDSSAVKSEELPAFSGKALNQVRVQAQPHVKIQNDEATPIIVDDADSV